MDLYPKRPPHLKEIWISRELYFVTCVTHNRLNCLDNQLTSAIMIDTWRNGIELYGWSTSDYVIMPDHVHFFCCPITDTKITLTEYVGRWKSYTARAWGKTQKGHSSQLWQPGFFDRLLRDETEWEEKYYYMLQNPVRAGLVNAASDWPYHGNLEL